MPYISRVLLLFLLGAPIGPSMNGLLVGFEDAVVAGISGGPFSAGDSGNDTFAAGDSWTDGGRPVWTSKGGIDGGGTDWPR
jgi:hypothetical protein